MNYLNNIASLPQTVVSFVREARAELKKVQWPSRQQTVRSTAVILVVSLIVAIVTGVFDYLLTWVIGLII